MPHSGPDQRLPLADIAQAIRSRRSINLFEPRPVDRQLLLEAIELARWAPNHRLTEPWRFYLVGQQTAETIAELAGDIDAAAKGEKARAARVQRLRGVPGMFVLTCRRSDAGLQEREDYAACCCAAQNLMLYVWQAGVGVKWTTGDVVRDERFYRLLGADPAAEIVVGLFWYGYPKIVAEQRRRDVTDIVTVLP